MKILAIRGQNLASLADPFDVDLSAEPIATAGLFAITGPTGAGKSTLLDALCLALFDELPRLTGAPRAARLAGAAEALSLSDPRHILHHGAAHGYAEVDFVGQDRQTYRSRWSVQRARRNVAGKLQEPKLELTSLPDGIRIGGHRTETKGEIEKRIGLNAAQFKRTVLLAQGEFDAFLRANGAERAALLERITGTEIYGALSKAAYERHAQEQAAVKARLAALGEHHPLGEAERHAADAALQTALKRRDGLAATARSVDEALAWLRTETAHGRAVASAENEQRDCLEALTAWRSGRDAQLSSLIKAAEKALDDTRQWEAAHPTAPLIADAQPNWSQALDQIAEGDTARRKLAQDRARLDEETAEVDARSQRLELALKSAAETVAQAEADVATRQANVSALAPLAATRGALDEAKALGQVLDRVRFLGTQRTSAEAERAQATEAFSAAEAESTKADTRLATALEAKATASNTLARARAVYEAVEGAASVAAEAMREALEPGSPCPICGSTEHVVSKAVIPLSADIARHKAELDTATESAERAANAYQDAVHHRIASAERVKAADDTLNRADAALNRAAAEQANAWAAAREHTGSPVFDTHGLDAGPKVPNATALDTAAAALADRIAALSTEETAAATAHTALETARHILERARVDESDARGNVEQISLAKQEHSVRSARLDALATEAETRRATALEALAACLDPLHPAWRDALAAGTLRQTLTETTTTAQQQQAAQQTADTARSDLVAEWDEWAQWDADQRFQPLPPADGTTELPPSTASAPSTSLERRRTAQQMLSRLRSADGVLAREQSAMDDHAKTQPPLAERQDLNALADTLRPALDAAAARAEETAADIAREDETRRRHGKAFAALEKQREEAAVWAQLNELIGSHDGAKFRRYAQALTLRRLVHLANAKLREFSPRYALRCADAPADRNDDLALTVQDRDMGDEERGVHNLSGGERFLVSLALSLGLASLSSDRGVRVETLFIDEGFGALDPESLGLAVAALENLQAGGRQIGVISHVEEMKERIAVQIVVTPTGGGKSTLRVTDRGGTTT
ncbi:MAG: AAA family ATPase [Pseudomonadota bacterium]